MASTPHEGRFDDSRESLSEPEQASPSVATRPASGAFEGSPALRGLVQRKIQRRVLRRLEARVAATDAAVLQAAQRGVEGAGGALPHKDAIQRAFGRHDVSHIEAHTGANAGAAADAIGAEAYAMGSKVAFAAAPSLFVAAHEAAHVVQQAAGVHLSSGVGQDGDAYEQHADAVAEQVVSGGSAESLLDEVAPMGAAGDGPSTAGVQRHSNSRSGGLGSGQVTGRLAVQRTGATTARQPTIGGEIDAYCTKCKLDLSHRILALVGDAVKKVECKTCNSHHLYRRPKVDRDAPRQRMARRAEERSSNATGSTKPSRAERVEKAQRDQRNQQSAWEHAVEGKPSSAFTSYRVSRTFERGELVKHPRFGDGVVAKIIDQPKVEILFRDDPRQLTQGA